MKGLCFSIVTILIGSSFISLGFNLGNTIKYISRAGKKDPKKELEDLKKAKFYLDYHIKTLEK